MKDGGPNAKTKFVLLWDPPFCSRKGRGQGLRARVLEAFRLHITNAEGIWGIGAENEVRRIHPSSSILHPSMITLKIL